MPPIAEESPKTRIKIAISTAVPGEYEQVWSGTPAHLVRELATRDDVEVAVLESPMPTVYQLANLASGISGRFSKRWNWEVEPAILRYLTSAARTQWQQCDADVVIAMGWMPRQLKADDPPVIFWGDASIAQRLDRAPHWSGVAQRTRRLIPNTEAQMLREVDAMILPSAWAVNGFEYCPSYRSAKIYRIGFGANIRDPGHIRRDLRDRQTYKALTIGVEWERKGIDVAVGAVRHLRKRGYKVDLDVVGAVPPDDSWIGDGIVYHGFLQKHRVEDSHKLDRLFRDADVFVLPSRSDPSPMVLGEAGAYSLPIIASDVDGIPERVSHGGLLLPRESSTEDYADAITRALIPKNHSVFSSGSRWDFEERSTWSLAAQRLVDVCRETISLATQRAGGDS